MMRFDPKRPSDRRQAAVSGEAANRDRQEAVRADGPNREAENQRVWLDRTGEPINIDRAWQKSDQRIALTRREQAMLAAAGMDGPEARWYVLRVDQGCDKAVDKALDDGNVERWMAVRKVEAKRRGCRKWQSLEPDLMPALPGYLFVRVVSCPATWAGLATVKGVAGVIGGADCPSPVPDKEVLGLKVFIESDPQAIEILTNALKAGDRVTIDDGPFAAFEAIVIMLGDGDRIKVEASLFGREVAIDLELAQVTKLD